MLFKDRNLSIAILISMSWHLVCIFSFTPILVSGNIRKNAAKISFLGSILDKFIAVQEKPLDLNRISVIEKIRDSGSERLNLPYAEYPNEATLLLPQASLDSGDTQPDKENIVFSEDKSKEGIFKIHHERKKRERMEFNDVLLSGGVKNRAVLYKPELPKISVLPSDFSFDYQVAVKFRISRHGFVESPECIISSGSTEIDQAAMRYIRKWQFVPDEEVSGLQEGVIRISFNNRN